MKASGSTNLSPLFWRLLTAPDRSEVHQKEWWLSRTSPKAIDGDDVEVLAGAVAFVGDHLQIVTCYARLVKLATSFDVFAI